MSENIVTKSGILYNEYRQLKSADKRVRKAIRRLQSLWWGDLLRLLEWRVNARWTSVFPEFSNDKKCKLQPVTTETTETQTPKVRSCLCIESVQVPCIHHENKQANAS